MKVTLKAIKDPVGWRTSIESMNSLERKELQFLMKLEYSYYQKRFYNYLRFKKTSEQMFMYDWEIIQKDIEEKEPGLLLHGLLQVKTIASLEDYAKQVREIFNTIILFV